MSMYAFYPDGHGQKSFFVCAEDLNAATAEVDFHIKMSLKNGSLTNYDVAGWGTPYYKFEIFEGGQVAENDND